jgi:hypothetical protein
MSEATGIAVGDTVLYVPHLCHKYDRDHLLNYAWVFKGQSNDRKGEMRELTHNEVETILGAVGPGVKRHDRGGERMDLQPIRPFKMWEGKVTAVNADGTLDLDIQHGGKPYQTLHYHNLHEDAGKIKPHTWHRKGA